ncbi:MAG: hypothetical protein JNJ40_04860 [Bacteroidia bacterium]|nr:hypothetical protein [Bacteroidia bacterium]
MRAGCLSDKPSISVFFGNAQKCKHGELLWIERILIEGSLEKYHLMHTEVDDVYECEKCKHSWKEFRYL